ncbi:MAG: DMT family transporter [Gammaproteobacteria bacterium]
MPSKLAAATLLPLAALLFGAAFWGVSWFPLRVLEARGLVGLWSTLIIYGTALAIGFAALALRRERLRWDGWVVLLLAASGWCNVAFILAVLEGNVVRVLLLFYLSPLWTVVLARLLLRERLSPAARITMAVAMAGALIMLWDTSTGAPWPRGSADWLALTSGFAFALSNVTIRRVQHVSVWGKTVAAWAGVVLVAGVWIALDGLALPPVGAGVVAGAVALGAFGMAAMTIAVVYGMTHMPAHRAAVVLLFELVVGAASAQWLTDEVVRPQEWAGGALILLAGWFAARAQMRSSQ